MEKTLSKCTKCGHAIWKGDEHDCGIRIVPEHHKHAFEVGRMIRNKMAYKKKKEQVIIAKEIINSSCITKREYEKALQVYDKYR